MEPIFKSKAFRYGVWLLLGLLILYFIWLLRPMFALVYGFLKAVLAPFVIAIIISYVLNPVVRMLGGRKVPRTIAVLLIYAVFLTALAVILMNVIPMFVEQLEELGEHLPELTIHTQQMMNRWDNGLLPGSVRMGMNNWFFQFENRLASAISRFLDNIGATIGVVFNAFIIPFLIFYMLKDIELIERLVLRYLPRSGRKSIITLLREIDQALGNYIRGQLLVCVIIGVLAYIGYMMIGMPFALLLAGVVAVCNIIPYLGPFLGAAPALVMATTISWKMVLFVLLVNMLCQTIESNVISPQVVGRSLHLHPMLIIFALLVGGEVAGVPGLILAVPLFAVMKVIIQHFFTYYVRRKAM
ncbi:AI-2E family transporter [Paenibacillus sp. FSL R5-0527]|uniref:AI-2E family transporter n=1 Tax=Paenibacillus TaxID=44249 RepID=UPI00097B9B58|nr:AI-2E family transporter [Paenibacillus macerans]MED4953638.1 AI-2E family transporter [Paenibacillus macerans]OMG47303.1 AI-2E family transporter [Paenibacillus macerans]